MDRHNIKSDHFRGVLWLANPSKLYASFEPFWKVEEPTQRDIIKMENLENYLIKLSTFY